MFLATHGYCDFLFLVFGFDLPETNPNQKTKGVVGAPRFFSKKSKLSLDKPAGFESPLARNRNFRWTSQRDSNRP
jgi:hypothetical protein